MSTMWIKIAFILFGLTLLKTGKVSLKCKVSTKLSSTLKKSKIPPLPLKIARVSQWIYFEFLFYYLLIVSMSLLGIDP